MGRVDQWPELRRRPLPIQYDILLCIVSRSKIILILFGDDHLTLCRCYYCQHSKHGHGQQDCSKCQVQNNNTCTVHSHLVLRIFHCMQFNGDTTVTENLKCIYFCVAAKIVDNWKSYSLYIQYFELSQLFLRVFSTFEVLGQWTPSPLTSTQGL